MRIVERSVDVRHPAQRLIARRAALAVLGVLAPQPHYAPVAVDVGPREREDLAAPPAGDVTEARHVLEVVGKIRDDRCEGASLEKPLARIPLREAPNRGQGAEVAAFETEPQSLPEELGLTVHRGRRHRRALAGLAREAPFDVPINCAGRHL